MITLHSFCPLAFNTSYTLSLLDFHWFCHFKTHLIKTLLVLLHVFFASFFCHKTTLTMFLFSTPSSFHPILPYSRPSMSPTSPFITTSLSALPFLTTTSKLCGFNLSVISLITISKHLDKICHIFLIEIVQLVPRLLLSFLRTLETSPARAHKCDWIYKYRSTCNSTFKYNSNFNDNIQKPGILVLF